ncbi:hypothetical protein [Phenylobacterium aquaticum]|uniref:hypothetical protein n=1 Tax=Phenylobacterium aquaticum TaxID=1763816 RepID=UPI0026F0981D|nr:hypothetical protein [Phenylobacterium aquaticum]
MSEAQSGALDRADTYAEILAQAAQTAALLADRNAAADGKDWYRSKGVSAPPSPPWAWPCCPRSWPPATPRLQRARP